MSLGKIKIGVTKTLNVIYCTLISGIYSNKTVRSMSDSSHNQRTLIFFRTYPSYSINLEQTFFLNIKEYWCIAFISFIPETFSLDFIAEPDNVIFLQKLQKMTLTHLVSASSKYKHPKSRGRQEQNNSRRPFLGVFFFCKCLFSLIDA